MATAKQKPLNALADQTPDAPLPDKLLDLVNNATEQDLRGPQPMAETLKGNTGAPNVWVDSPATFRFSAASNRRLINVARLSGMSDNKVLRVHARFVGDSNVVLIKPAGELDMTAFEVGYYKGAAGGAVNLYDLLGPARTTVQAGYRQRYNVHLVPKTSSLFPGLLIDLDDPKERKTITRNKKKKQQQQQPQQPPQPEPQPE
jgi:hypothetical protein